MLKPGDRAVFRYQNLRRGIQRPIRAGRVVGVVKNRPAYRIRLDGDSYIREIPADRLELEK